MLKGRTSLGAEAWSAYRAAKLDAGRRFFQGVATGIHSASAHFTLFWTPMIAYKFSVGIRYYVDNDDGD